MRKTSCIRSIKFCIIRTKIALLAFALMLSGMSALKGACGFSWGPQSSVFQYSDVSGCVNVTHNLGEIELSGDSPIPLYINFNSGRKTGSDILGYGWLINLTDMKAAKTEANKYTVYFPDGQSAILGLKKNNTYSNGSWALRERQNSLQLVGKCGVEVIFTNGTMRKYKSSKGTAIDFNYSGNRLASVTQNGKELLGVSYDDENDRIILELKAKKEAVEIKCSKTKPVGKMLASIEKRGGSPVTFSYNFSSMSVWEMTMGSDDFIGPRKFSWDAKSGAIKTCELKNESYSFEVRDNEIGKFISRRKRSNGHEDIFNEGPRGISVSRIDNGPIVTTYSLTSGPHLGKPRKVVTSRDGKTDETLYNYDEKGRVIRKIQNGAVVLNLKYNDKENSITFFDAGGKAIRKKGFDAKGRIVSDETPGEKKTVFEYLPDGKTKATLEKGGKKISHLFD